MSGNALNRTLVVALLIAVSLAMVTRTTVGPMSNIASTVASITSFVVPAKPGFSFRDDFNYNTLTDLQAAGWALCGAPPSYSTVGNGILNLTNDAVYDGAVCYSNILPRVTSWTVSARGRWTGNSFGSIEIVVTTKDHRYRWDADGYYNQFILLRDDVIVFRINGYSPQLNVWHTLRLDADRKLGLSMHFDGVQIGSFVDTPRTDYSMKGLELMAGWVSSESWDFITAHSVRHAE